MADRHTDILIVGGGVVGWNAAYQLRARGRSVTIVDASSFGSSCSFDNAGQLVPSHMEPLCAPGVTWQALRWMLSATSPFKLHLRADLDLLRWLWTFWRHCTRPHVDACIPLLARLQLENKHLLADLVEREQLDCGLEQRGLLLLSREPDHAKGRKLAEEASAHGMQATYCEDRNALGRFEPALEQSSACSGVHYLDDAHLNPSRFVHALADKCRELGVAFEEETRVERIERKGSRIESVQTDKGSFSADEYILAAGAWTPHLARQIGLKAPIQPGKGYSLTFPMPDSAPAHPLILGDDRVVVTPLGDKLRISGTMEIGGRAGTIDTRRTGAIVDTWRRWFPEEQAPEPSQTDVWAGLRPCTSDGLPMIGRTRKLENLTFAAGHAMLGVSMGAVTGQLVADAIDLVAGPDDLQLLAPDRFQ